MFFYSTPIPVSLRGRGCFFILFPSPSLEEDGDVFSPSPSLEEDRDVLNPLIFIILLNGGGNLLIVFNIQIFDIG